MSSSFKIILNTRVDNDLQRSIDPVRAYRGIQEGLEEIGKELVDTARDGIKSPPKTGRIYIINGKWHQASAAGEYPANLSGALQESLSHRVENLTMEFGADTKYAKILQQFDTPRKTKGIFKSIPARPFLTLSHNENKADFVPIMNKTMRAQL